MVTGITMKNSSSLTLKPKLIRYSDNIIERSNYGWYLNSEDLKDITVDNLTIQSSYDSNLTPDTSGMIWMSINYGLKNKSIIYDNAHPAKFAFSGFDDTHKLCDFGRLDKLSK
jgi:hypothetical protein